MAAPDLLLIKPVSVMPPCITASSVWPSRVSVTLAVSMRDSRYPHMPHAAALSEDDGVATDLFNPWLLSAFQSGSEYALPRQVPTCVHSSSEEVLVTFRDVEVTAPVPGVISLALCPAVPEHSLHQKATIEAIPLMVSPNKGGSAEAVAMFDCMRHLVQQQGLTQQQQHHEIPHAYPFQQQLVQQQEQNQHAVDCWVAAGGRFPPAAPTDLLLAGMGAPEGLSFNLPAHEQLAAAATAAAGMPGSCCACCGFGSPDAAAEQHLLRTTWQQHFLPLLLDMHAALTCVPKPLSCKHHKPVTAAAEQLAAAAPNSSTSCSFAAAARIPNALEGWAQHTTAALRPFSSPAATAATHPTPTAAAAPAAGMPVQPAILLELAGCAPPPVDVAGQMLIGVIEFLALHNCWCNVSFLLAEAFKNGLLAATGVLAAQQLQRLHELQRMQAPVCAAALTAASLVASLVEGAAAVEEEAEKEAELAAGAARKSEAGCGKTGNSCTGSSSSNCAAPAAAPAPTNALANAEPTSKAIPAANNMQHSATATSAAAAGYTVMAAVLLLLVMPVGLLLLAHAAEPGGASMMCIQGRSGASPALRTSSSSAVVSGCWAAAVMSVMLLVMVAATCRRSVVFKNW